MTEEIKEKLEAIASDDDINLLWNEANDLLNYITNLQKENNSYKQSNEKASNFLNHLRKAFDENDEMYELLGSAIDILEGGDE